MNPTRYRLHLAACAAITALTLLACYAAAVYADGRWAL